MIQSLRQAHWRWWLGLALLLPLLLALVISLRPALDITHRLPGPADGRWLEDGGPGTP